MSNLLFTELATLADLHAVAAERVLVGGREALDARGRFHLVLAGGNTPRALYEGLAKRAGDLDWTRVHLWWGDERCVPRDHADSNFKMAWDAWLSAFGLPEERVHRMRGELGLPAAVEDYASQIRSEFGAQGPVFDFVLLGLGTDGHTASLFPAVAAAGGAWVVGISGAPKPPRERISLSERALGAARRRLFLVAGGDKAAPLEEIRRRGSGVASRIAWAGASEICFFRGSESA
ncbi:MAG TPA: 6-phosphogluconolactonase [Candidatus Krumholzibacteria bacterium]